MSTTAGPSRCSVAGFTLIEVLVTVLILGIVAKFAMMKLVRPAEFTLPSQAQAVVDAVRRAQSLALVNRQRMSVSVASSGGASPIYSIVVACTVGGSCTSTGFSLALDKGATVTANPGVLYFNSLGVPMDSASNGNPLATNACFTLSQSGAGALVKVQTLTGRASADIACP